MDKIDAPVIGIGILAAMQILNSLKNKDNCYDMKAIMRSENTEIENLTNGDSEAVATQEESIVPGIALNQFVSKMYKIGFKYPRAWSKNPRYEDKYEGETGFFEVGDFSGVGEDIDEAVKMQVNEDYKPYGSNPTIRRFIVDGQPARVIYPSDDQSEFYNDREAAIVVKYPEPISVEGKTYDYVVIWASKAYIPLIISTFRFVK